MLRRESRAPGQARCCLSGGRRGRGQAVVPGRVYAGVCQQNFLPAGSPEDCAVERLPVEFRGNVRAATPPPPRAPQTCSRLLVSSLTSSASCILSSACEFMFEIYLQLSSELRSSVPTNMQSMECAFGHSAVVLGNWLAGIWCCFRQDRADQARSSIFRVVPTSIAVSRCQIPTNGCSESR